MFKYESWKRASSGHIHLKGKFNHFINMRRDCCGISPTFLCLRGSSGWDCLKRYSKLIQSTVTAQKCFASTACLVYTTWITQSSQPPWGTCRPSCWRWHRAAAWIESANLVQEAALELDEDCSTRPCSRQTREAASTGNIQPVKTQHPQKSKRQSWNFQNRFNWLFNETLK